jgi:phosphoglycolate phosphatase-like HAD superfamily hydrolase
VTLDGLEGPEPSRLLDALDPFSDRDQVWLDLERPDRAPGPEHLDRWLTRIGAGPEPPLVVLVADDAPVRSRTHRLAVDGPGRVLLVRGAAAPDQGYVLGRVELLAPLGRVAPWAGEPGPVRPRPPRSGDRLLVLDVDGVLIDPGRAFQEAVAGALGELAPGLAWSAPDYQSLKRAGGFNNDFRLAAGALALAERGWTPRTPGIPWMELEARMAELEPRCRVAVRRHYLRTRRLERPLVAPEQVAAVPGPVAVYTGRPPEELASAFDLLGFRLPAVADRAPHLRKPRPEGLLQLADSFRAGRIIFVGDGRDDAAALAGARALRPDLDWIFAAVGPDRALIAGPRDRQGSDLADLAEHGGLR